jgi:Zn-dependent peptidase ImmA (M78 family)
MRLFIERAEVAGVLVMISGVVKNITKRPLDPDEFRGFALSDRLAPLIFINGADSKAAQIFTLAHELSHLWLGKSALSNANISGLANSNIEKWCNKVAAEFLVPLAEIKQMGTHNALTQLDTYADTFKVSKLVILRRLLDAELVSRKQFDDTYGALIRVIKPPAPTTGGDFYNTLPARASKRFVKALVASTLEGQTLYSDAFQMLGIRSTKAFLGIGQKVGAL